MKLFVIGLWVLLVTLGSTYATAVYLPARMSAAHSAEPNSLDYAKTRVIHVPMLADGAVQGFIAMQFAFTIDGATLRSLEVPPEIYLLDEAFRAVYTDHGLDPHHLEKYDLAQLTARLVERTNAHLGAPLIREVLIENFSYISKDAIN